MSKWVHAVCTGNKVGIFLGDISGAFDHVRRSLLVAKLLQLGLPPSFCDFINSYLLPREGRVTIEGAVSDAIVLSDMCFQGTCLGPSLWNCFFRDVTDLPQEVDAESHLFADDITMTIVRPVSQTNDSIFDVLNILQQHCHRWGVRNQVKFDDAKEHKFVVHPRHGSNGSFRFLGVEVDARLNMKETLDKVASRIKPRIRALLRVRQLYSLETLLTMYKMQVWSIIEYQNPGLMLVCPSQLKRLDRIQRWFLHELGLSDTEAFLQHNVAPPSLRRTIGVLGFLHKAQLGLAHPGVRAFFEQEHPGAPRFPHLHNKRLKDKSEGVTTQWPLFRRSVLEYISIYNRLPQAFADATSVSSFQTLLTKEAKRRAEAALDNWRESFTSCGDVLAIAR